MHSLREVRGLQDCSKTLEMGILRSDTASQITPFLRKYFLRHYVGQLKTAVEQEAGEEIDWERQSQSEKQKRI